jgi:hypothetical protein
VEVPESTLYAARYAYFVTPIFAFATAAAIFALDTSLAAAAALQSAATAAVSAIS